MPTLSQAKDVSTLISIMPIGISESKPGLIPGEYKINGVKDPSREVKTLLVARARFPVYIDENRPALIVPEPSDRVCEAICRDFKVGIMGYEPGRAEPGLTWVTGEFSPRMIEDQLATEMIHLRANQLMWFQNIVSLADDDWQKYHMRRMISSLQRLACSLLKLEREWNIEDEIGKQAETGMTPCKFCRQLIHFEAIVCPHCSGILNMERYKKEFVSAATLSSAASVGTK